MNTGAWSAQQLTVKTEVVSNESQTMLGEAPWIHGSCPILLACRYTRKRSVCLVNFWLICCIFLLWQAYFSTYGTLTHRFASSFAVFVELSHTRIGFRFCSISVLVRLPKYYSYVPGTRVRFSIHSCNSSIRYSLYVSLPGIVTCCHDLLAMYLFF